MHHSSNFTTDIADIAGIPENNAITASLQDGSGSIPFVLRNASSSSLFRYRSNFSASKSSGTTDVSLGATDFTQSVTAMNERDSLLFRSLSQLWTTAARRLTEDNSVVTSPSSTSSVTSSIASSFVTSPSTSSFVTSSSTSSFMASNASSFMTSSSTLSSETSLNTSSFVTSSNASFSIKSPSTSSFVTSLSLSITSSVPATILRLIDAPASTYEGVNVHGGSASLINSPSSFDVGGVRHEYLLGGIIIVTLVLLLLILMVAVSCTVVGHRRMDSSYLSIPASAAEDESVVGGATTRGMAGPSYQQRPPYDYIYRPLRGCYSSGYGYADDGDYDDTFVGVSIPLLQDVTVV